MGGLLLLLLLPPFAAVLPHPPATTVYERLHPKSGGVIAEGVSM